MSEDKGKGKKKKEEAPVVWSELIYTCDYCRKDISNTVRIKCADCADELDLCIECFSVGVEIRKHKSSHAFRIIDNMQFPFFTHDWSADEEQLMLEGLEQDGWGNWEDVSGHVNTKTKAEVRDHYMSLYHNPQWLPTTAIPLSTRQDVINYNRDPSLLEKIAPRARGSKRQSSKVVFNKPQPSRPVRPELANYMPLRGEFEYEWNNDAEMTVRDILFEGPDEPQADVDVKLKLLELYNLRLDERDEKRAFVIERGLHDTKKTKEAEKKRTKEERDIMNKTKKFLSLPAMSGDAYDQFIDNLYLEYQLRQKIAEFQLYRSQGLRTIAETEAYKIESDKDAGARRGRPGIVGVGKKGVQDDRFSNKKVGIGARGRGAIGTGASGFLADASKSAAAEWISDAEKELASLLRLEIDTYATMKETLVREYVKRGELKRSYLRQLFSKMDTKQLAPLFDFWEEAGWINKRTPKDQQVYKQHQQAVAAATASSSNAAGIQTRGAVQHGAMQVPTHHPGAQYGHHPGAYATHGPNVMPNSHPTAAGRGAPLQGRPGMSMTQHPHYR